MIPIAAGARLWIATGHTDMRKGMQVWHCWCKRGLGETPLPATSLCSVGALARRGRAIAAGGRHLPLAEDRGWRDAFVGRFYAVEKDRGRSPEERRAVRSLKSRPLVAALEPWLRAKLVLISQKSNLATAIRYALSR